MAVIFGRLSTKSARLPSPPYIEWHDSDEHTVRQLYQTTYAKHNGSAAAPTAGLHFTPELDQKLMAKGVQIEEVTLHVGLGTFLPVKNLDITTHHMHQEQYEIKADTAERLNQAKQAGKRIIAVGTTTTRVLETVASPLLKAQTGETDIFIYPPYQFKFVDSLITNFHLPKSTLLMLISALASAPNTSQSFETFEQSPVGQAYAAAIKEKYRFFSFGDGMMIR